MGSHSGLSYGLKGVDAGDNLDSCMSPPKRLHALHTHTHSLHRGFPEDSQRTRRELTEDSQSIYRGLTEDSQRTHRGPTARGLAEDPQRTHRGFAEDLSSEAVLELDTGFEEILLA